MGKKNALDAEALWRLRRPGPPVGCSDGTCLVAVTRYQVDDNIDRSVVYRVYDDGTHALLSPPTLHASLPAASPNGHHIVAVLRRGENHERHYELAELSDEDDPRVICRFDRGVRQVRFVDDERILCLVDVAIPNADPTLGRPAESSAHVTEDRVYRFWNRWLSEGIVPHFFVVDRTSGEAVDLMPDSRLLFDLMNPSDCFDISPDGQRVLFDANRTEPPYDTLVRGLYELSLDGGSPVRFGSDHHADQLRPRFTPDGTKVVFGRKERAEFYADRVRLVIRDIATGEETALTETWDQSPTHWECRNDEVLFAADHRGRSNLYRLSFTGGTPIEFSGGGTAGAIAIGDKGVWFHYHDLRTPPELRLFRSNADTALRVSWNEEILASFQLGAVEEQTIEGADGEPVQLILVVPPGTKADRPLPLVHLIHGGPHSTFADAFHFRWSAQVIAGAGYLVALTNFHGSSSFGTTFTESILGRWGDQPATDIEAATDHLVQSGRADPDRMAITGGSYGGYLTARLATRVHRYRCGIVHAGVYDTEAMYATDASFGLELAQGARPWDDSPRAERYNPARHVGDVQTPLLVVHGEKDYRVPYTQGLQLYGSLRAMGKPARLVIYPDEGHWIQKPQNSLHWYGEFLRWLDLHLSPTGP
ncbi:MAG: S9 family peptidase [Myxococcota bacterium]